VGGTKREGSSRKAPQKTNPAEPGRGGENRTEEEHGEGGQCLGCAKDEGKQTARPNKCSTTGAGGKPIKKTAELQLGKSTKK